MPMLSLKSGGTAFSVTALGLVSATNASVAAVVPKALSTAACFTADPIDAMVYGCGGDGERTFYGTTSAASIELPATAANQRPPHHDYLLMSAWRDARGLSRSSAAALR